MNRDDVPAHITIDHNVCWGKPYIREHRICVFPVLDSPASVWSTAELMRPVQCRPALR